MTNIDAIIMYAGSNVIPFLSLTVLSHEHIIHICMSVCVSVCLSVCLTIGWLVGLPPSISVSLYQHRFLLCLNDSPFCPARLCLSLLSAPSFSPGHPFVLTRSARNG